MNKQEYIGKLKKLLEAPSELKGSDLDIFYNMAIKRAIHLAEYLDEKPNKHKKMKEIADRYDKQQLIDKIKSLKFDKHDELNSWGDGYNTGLQYSIDAIKETGFYHIKDKDNTPTHYQGSVQPIDLINAQELNFNLGNVVKYVCRAGKKEGENTLSDLEKAKDYINFEIERVKK